MLLGDALRDIFSGIKEKRSHYLLQYIILFITFRTLGWMNIEIIGEQKFIENPMSPLSFLEIFVKYLLLEGKFNRNYIPDLLIILFRTLIFCVIIVQVILLTSERYSDQKGLNVYINCLKDSTQKFWGFLYTFINFFICEYFVLNYIDLSLQR